MGRGKKRKRLSKEEKRWRRKRRGIDLDKGDGVFAPFSDTHRELAMRETRLLTVSRLDVGVPPGDYLFVETFCKGKACDCRRVMFQVFDRPPGNCGDFGDQPVLIIGYGWEPSSFYQSWVGDPEIAKAMKGPQVDPNSPLCPFGRALLELFQMTCLRSEDYLERVARHYWLFKETRGMPRPSADGAAVLGLGVGTDATQ